MPKRQRQEEVEAKPATSKQVKISSDPPSFLDADSTITASKYAATRLHEMKSLWFSFLEKSTPNSNEESYYKSKGCTISNRHLRRRTGSHNRRMRHRYPQGNELESKGKSRKTRRKPKLLQEKHSHWQNTNVESEESNWLTTHLWHTKRFRMSPPLSIYNNWCIPLGHTNRGTKSALRLAHAKSTIQDATWNIGGQAFILKSKEVNDLIQVIELICGGSRAHSASFLESEDVIDGLEAADGFIYELNSFPKGILGPATFLFGKEDSSDMSMHFVRILVHVGIMDRFNSLLSIALDSLKDSVDIEQSKTAVSLLRVRGAQATATLKTALEFGIGDNLKEGDIPDDLHTHFSHGSIISGILTKIKGTTFDSGENAPKSGEVKTMNGDQFMNELTDAELKQSDIEKNTLTLISQLPNGKSSSNTVVSGWDILCHSSQTREIFIALTNVAGACAIGFIEDSMFRLEAEPPLPIFPRDYPDSIIAENYFKGDNPEWKILRYCIEEGIGGGRVKTGINRLLRDCIKEKDDDKTKKTTHPSSISRRLTQFQFDWNSLFSQSESNSATNHVLVRGDFVAPFIDALTQFGETYFQSLEQNNQRRPRRSTRNPTDLIVLPPCSKEKFEQHKLHCSNLLKSMSIPALLRVFVEVQGRGTACSGMKILSNEKVLGYITVGGFSQQRGKSHGVGIISSLAFLTTLSSCEQGSFFCQRNSEISLIGLKVILHSEECKYATKHDTVASLKVLK